MKIYIEFCIIRIIGLQNIDYIGIINIVYNGLNYIKMIYAYRRRNFMDKKIGIGNIQISDDVISKIASTAALEVEGVSSAAGKATSGISEFLGVKNQSKVAKIIRENGETIVDLEIAVDSDARIHETAAEVQRQVKNAVETMTGIKVIEVNVNVLALTVKAKKDENDE